MVNNLFPNFLEDPTEYDNSEKLWMKIWTDIAGNASLRHNWITPWLGTGSPSIKDGNPIFSAFSPQLRRGIRIIQQEPLNTDLDFQLWLDTTEDDPFNDGSVSELVIACVLSDVARYHAKDSMMAWVEGEPLTLHRENGGRLVLKTSSRTTSNRNIKLNAAA